MTGGQANPRSDPVQLSLQYAAENRRAEISLLWTRAAYFWAFLAVAIASFGSAIHTSHRTLALLVACFATICSLCWTLANRAGKYWQEVWERKVEEIEQCALDRTLFSRQSNPAIDESWFWGAKQYSPSRLASAVSDCSTALWAMLALVLTFFDLNHPITIWRIAILLVTILYTSAILVWCKSGSKRPTSLRQALNQLSTALQDWRSL